MGGTNHIAYEERRAVTEQSLGVQMLRRKYAGLVSGVMLPSLSWWLQFAL
jgi:hypothetical protein